jgi:hypothetical protein
MDRPNPAISVTIIFRSFWLFFEQPPKIDAASCVVGKQLSRLVPARAPVGAQLPLQLFRAGFPYASQIVLEELVIDQTQQSKFGRERIKWASRKATPRTRVVRRPAYKSKRGRSMNGHFALPVMIEPVLFC